MKLSEKVGCLLGVLAIFITTPIWYYLLYEILVYIHASQLMWFLFWVYLPVSIFVAVVAETVKYFLKDKK